MVDHIGWAGRLNQAQADGIVYFSSSLGFCTLKFGDKSNGTTACVGDRMWSVIWRRRIYGSRPMIFDNQNASSYVQPQATKTMLSLG